MTGTGDDRIRDLLATGWAALESGRSREAGDAFGRVLLQTPDHPEAQRGRAAARSATAEEARRLDALIEEARRALQDGDRAGARSLLEEVILRGGDRDRARALLDRAEEQGSRLGLAGTSPAAEREPEPAAAPARRTWSRRAFAACCALAFAVLGTGLALVWDRILDSLIRPPAPHARAYDAPSAAADAGRAGAAP